MEEISVQDKKYVKAKLLARELGYTNDYIGQLCRAGKVDAQLVGRTWYVEPDSIKSHKRTRYRSSKASTRRELQTDVIRALSEERTARNEHFYATHKLRPHTPRVAYETDESELVPVPKKHTANKVHTLPVELAEAEKVAVEVKNEKKYHFEAPEREEIRFFGTLKVTDFITDVPVSGEEDAPQAVTVRNGRTAVAPAKEVDVVRSKKPAASKKYPSHPVHVSVHADSQSEMVAVEIDESALPLPFRYRVIQITAFASSLVLAALCVGLEATITATADQVTVAYSFAVENISALVYLVK